MEERPMNINNIFSSINGEVSHLGQGSLCTFIRLQGCNLKPGCSYCDTLDAQDENEGRVLSIKEIVKKVQSLKSKNVTITGGEPLCQVDLLHTLVKDLHLLSYTISIETNGSYRIPHWGGLVQSWIADWKTPCSGMRKKMNYSNFQNLWEKDYVKFVLKDVYDWKDAIAVIKQFNKQKGTIGSPSFAFSPMFRKDQPYTNVRTFVEWMKEDKTCLKNNVILNLQLHKIIEVS
jgi:7-carboxy-7-deazaguanine synthase